MSSLQNQSRKLEKGGFSQKEITNWKKEKIFQLEKGGFETPEILKEFGFEEINTQPIEDIYSDLIFSKEEKKTTYDQLKQLEDDDAEPSLKEAFVGKKLNNIGLRIKKGWESATYDLIQQAHNIPNLDGTQEDGKYFNLEIADTGILERNITNATRLIKDLPLYLGVGGATMYATRSPTASIFTSGLAVGSIRETYLNMLENGEVGNWSNFWKSFREVGLKAGVKEGLQLTSAAKLGGLSNKFLPQLIARVTGFEGMGIALNHELPSKDQLIDSFILFGAFGLAERSAFKVKNIIKKTNLDVVDLLAEYKLNPSIPQDMSAKNIGIPRQLKSKEEIKVGDKILDEKFLENIDFDKPVEKVLSKMSFEKPKDKEAFKNDFVRLFVDRLHPILRLVRRVESTKNTKGVLNIYEQFRLLLGMDYRAGAFIDIATQTKNLENKGKSYKSILEPLKHKNLETPKTNVVQKFLGLKKAPLNYIKKQYAELNAYLHSRRIIEFEQKGLKHGADIKAAKETVQLLKNKYDKMAKEIDTYQRDLLEYARDLGLINKKAFDAMVEANKSYVPWSRIMEIKNGKGYAGVSNPFKRVKGGDQPVVDILETIYSNTFRIVKLAERNNALNKTFDFIEKNKSAFPDINKKIETKVMKIEKKQLEPILDDVSAINDVAIENFKIFRKEFSLPDGTSVKVYRNNKFETWEVGKELADAMKDFDPRQVEILTRAMRVAGGPARLLRVGATTSPDFVFANILRDTVSATIFSKSGFIPIWSSLEGAMIIALGKSGISKRAKQIMEDWQKSGGMQSTLMSLDRMIYDKAAFKILNEAPIRNKVFNIMELLRTASEVGENMTRVAEFAKTTRKGRKEGLKGRELLERGGFESRDVTIDYAKMGAYMKGLNMLTAFYNARVQGYAKIYDAFSQRPGRAMTAITASVILPSMYLWFANRDNPVYLRQPQWVKDNYWIIVIGDVPHRIPKPFDIGVVFGTGTEQFLDWTFKNDANARNNMLDFLSEFGMSQIKNINPIPTILVPPLEAAFNKSFFTGNPLVPEYMDKQLLSPNQYNPYTSEFSKAISRGISILVGDHLAPSPIKIDNFIKGWSGGLGNYVKMAIDQGLISGGLIEDPIRPTDSLTKIPGLRAFNLRDPSMQSEYITDFYEEYNKYKKYKPTIEALKKEGNYKEAVKLQKRSKIFNDNIAIFSTNYIVMKDIGENIRRTYNMKIIDGDQKQIILDSLYLEMIKIAKDSLNLLNYTKN